MNGEEKLAVYKRIIQIALENYSKTIQDHVPYIIDDRRKLDGVLQDIYETGKWVDRWPNREPVPKAKPEEEFTI